ncbi:MAG: TonB-dependent receptor plug domain-containing protein [Candidatus Cryptobacteroides sp.]
MNCKLKLQSIGKNAMPVLLVSFLFAVSQSLYAQGLVTGKVTDEFGEALAGIAVTAEINGKLTGTTTDSDGRYSIKAGEGVVLEFSSIGYVSQKIEIKGQSQVNAVLKDDTKLLDEVIVIGYGTVKKKDILGSISTVKGNDLTDRGSGNVIESMRGKIAGVKITSSGQPGSNGTMRIRGLGSFSNNSPLYIVDGSYGGSELGLNVEDIESIQVLKDASSAAIYGSRAANGVVIITTKKGHSGKLKV